MEKNYQLIGKVVLMLVFSFVLSLVFQHNTYASANTKLYINGYSSEKYPSPVLLAGHSYVPADALEMLFGYSVSYDEVTEVITLDQSELNVRIQMSVGKNFAIVNNINKDLSASLITADGKPMVSLRFVSEAIESKVVWEPGFLYDENDYLELSENRILIYSPHAIKLDSGNASIASKIYVQSQSHRLTDLDERERKVGFDVVIPVMSEMDDAGFQKQLNDKFASLYENIKQETESIYNKQKQDEPEYLFDSSDDLRFYVADDTANLLSLVFEEYVYTGGAHGMPYRFAFNMDIKNAKLLGLSDLFVKGKDYAKKLVEQMNVIRLASSSMEYVDVEEVTQLPQQQMSKDLSFYIKDDTLYIFYHPYELSYYARGFVDFRIPLESLNEYTVED